MPSNTLKKRAEECKNMLMVRVEGIPHFVDRVVEDFSVNVSIYVGCYIDPPTCTRAHAHMHIHFPVTGQDYEGVKEKFTKQVDAFLSQWPIFHSNVYAGLSAQGGSTRRRAVWKQVSPDEVHYRTRNSDSGSKSGNTSKSDSGRKSGNTSKSDSGSKSGNTSKGDSGSKSGNASKGDSGSKSGNTSKGDSGSKTGGGKKQPGGGKRSVQGSPNEGPLKKVKKRESLKKAEGAVFEFPEDNEKVRKKI